VLDLTTNPTPNG